MHLLLLSHLLINIITPFINITIIIDIIIYYIEPSIWHIDIDLDCIDSGHWDINRDYIIAIALIFILNIDISQPHWDTAIALHWLTYILRAIYDIDIH